jgi:hypothetical protein
LLSRKCRAKVVFEASCRRPHIADTDQREIAETAFRRNPKRDEINDAMKQEHTRREAAVKNLYRLRALRLARDGNTRTK